MKNVMRFVDANFNEIQINCKIFKKNYLFRDGKLFPVKEFICGFAVLPIDGTRRKLFTLATVECRH